MALLKAAAFSVALGLGFFSTQPGYAGACVEDIGETVTLAANGATYDSGRIIEYIAHIAPRDLYNSKGVRLRDVGAILQQDRANLHKTGVADGSGDFSDRFEDYFTTLKRRQLLSAAPRFYYCGLSKAGIARFEQGILNAQLPGLVWVAGFRLPDGTFALALSQVD